ncbi:peptidylprolyl isomerase [Maribacter sp. 2-571]|uniref:peptidylprolyl isomerase n=1 Tax=Maribacter sp. 2-571 TaxID=3417569 RepID=UPI003D346490
MKKNKTKLLIGIAILALGFSRAQSNDSIVETINPVPEDKEMAMGMDSAIKKDTVSTFKRVKLDGIAAVVGDYVILESDIEKTLIDLKNQGAATEGLTRCGLLGKLMEDRLYAHQAVQDSILVSDDEVNAQGERQLQSLVQQIGSMDKVLRYYKKPDETSFREELYKINKLRMLSEKMQQEIVSKVEVTPEEVRQFFNKISESERPVFGAELEIAQIVKQPEPTDAEIQVVLDKLNKIKADVEDNGASFSVKAILYSQGPTKTKGGLIEGITKQSGYVKEFKDVAFSLREGAVSDPFKTMFGYHIMYIEKIRGQERDVRHILIQPEISKQAMENARAELDTIRQHILDGKYTFAQAALNFSDEEETKYDGGVLRNPINFDSRFELTKMDPKLYNQVRNLKDDEISRPLLEQDQRGGGPSLKLLRVTNRYDEHVADFSKDYMKIQQLATTEKQYKTIKEWMDKHIKDTYISVNESRKDCEFANNWMKK